LKPYEQNDPIKDINITNLQSSKVFHRRMAAQEKNRTACITPAKNVSKDEFIQIKKYMS
jgi:hypothetical protein